MSVNQLSDNNPDGTALGQSATDKIGFYGATPVDRPAAASQAAATATAVTAVLTTASVTTAAHGFATGTQADAIVARVNQLVTDVGALATGYNAIRAALVSTGLIKGAA